MRPAASGKEVTVTGSMIVDLAGTAATAIRPQVAAPPELTSGGHSEFRELMDRVAQSRTVEPRPPDSSPSPAFPGVRAEPTASLRATLQRIDGGQRSLDRIMDLAMHGRQFSPQELLGIQIGVCRLTQELELTSKVIEQATSSVKTAMQTQV
jgi:hypothetical protein